MSDQGRKDFSDKLHEKAKPDSQKTTVDQVKEYATDAYDRLAADAQPNQDKSFTQKVGDAGRDAKDNFKKN